MTMTETRLFEGRWRQLPNLAANLKDSIHDDNRARELGFRGGFVPGPTVAEAIMPANPTKSATILKLLRRPKGTSIAQLQKATDWQAHSIRAALTGLRKKGHEIERSGKDGKGATVYRMAKGA